MKETAEGLFEKFLKASTCKATLQTFRSLCKELNLVYPPARTTTYDHITFYVRLKQALGTYWKAQSLFSKLDKIYDNDVNFTARKSSRDGRERASKDMNVLIIGAGPCGLRTAICTALLGAKTVVVEKRDSFSRNNVLHLWPFTIEDLKSLGAKKFNGRFCSGAIDHVSIRQLQLILTKSALIFGVEIHVNNAFVDLVPPNIEGMTAWRAKIDPEHSPVNDFQFHMIVGADGRKNTLQGFTKKEFRGSLAIGITANFINKHTTAEARVSEISGINFIYRQDFFRAMNMEHNIDLENIVYYKDDTHYFVMTARKQSLCQRGVFRQNLDDPRKLVHNDNIDQKALLKYALDAVNFSTENKLPDLEVAINNYGLPDIALFDFTCMKSSVNASMFQEVNGVKLLKVLVGDGLLEPFWPKGTGIAKGFLAAYDSSWMLRQWTLGKLQDKVNDRSLEMGLLSERESLYRVLAQTESNNLVQNYTSFTIDPRSRYQFVPKKLSPGQVRSFYVTDGKELETVPLVTDKPDGSIVPPRLTRTVSFVKSNKLQQWCEKVLHESGASVNVSDMSSSWKDGYALCTIINYYRPDILDLEKLQPDNAEYNNQLAFDAAEEHLGIVPIMSGKEMAECEAVDDLVIVTYISQFYEILKNETPVKPIKRVSDIITTPPEDSLPKAHRKKKSPLGLLTRISQQIKRKSVQRGSHKEYDLDSHDTKRRKTFGKKETGVAASQSNDIVLTKAVLPTIPDEDKENTVLMRKDSITPGVRKSATNRISALGLQLISQLEQNSDMPSPKPTKKPVVKNSSSECYFCGQTVYIVERLSVEGLFFHRQCFKCTHCETILRPMSYKRDCGSGKFYCTVHYFANAEYLKQPNHDDPETSEARKPSLPEIEIEESADGVEDAPQLESPTPRSPIEDLNLSVPTIEHGMVVMRRDLTPKRGDMEQMALSISSIPVEIEEDQLYQHNMRCSHNSDTEEDYTSDSEAEELDELANLTGLRNRSAQDILTEYHNHREASSIAATSGSAFLSSESEGDDDVSSLSSTSADETEMTTEKGETDNVIDPSKLENDQLSDHELQDVDDQISLSSASTNEENEEGEQFFNDDSNNNNSVINVERKDTLETTERYLLEHPIGGKRSLSSSSSAEEDGVGDQEDLVTLLRKDTLDKAEEHIKQHPMKRSRTLSSSSSEAEEEDDDRQMLEKKQDEVVSSESSDAEIEAPKEQSVSIDSIDATPAPVKTKNDTSVWVTDSGDAVDSAGTFDVNHPMEDDKLNLLNSDDVVDSCGGLEVNARMEEDKLSSQDTEEDMLDLNEEEGLESLLATEESFSTRNVEVVASTPKFSSFMPSDSSEIFMTPCAERTDPDESFYTVKSEQSPSQDISSYISPNELGTSFASNTTATDSYASETPKSSSTMSNHSPRRQLPETPKVPGRRRLPVIPHLEAMSPTKSDVSPKQQRRIEMKLKKHEDRVMERIKKMKLGANGSSESGAVGESGDSKAAEREEFVNQLPLFLQRRNNALMRKKHKPDKSGGETKKGLFHFGHKKKHRELPTSPPAKVLSPTTRSSRRRDLSSYSREELDNRVSHRVQLAAQRQAQEAERKRMARACVIQGQLQEVDSKRKQLEERGVELEKLLRNQKSRGVRPRDSSLHMHEWFKLVQEKNALLRYENELMIYQRELQLEDRHSRLEQELRKSMSLDDSKKSAEELTKEKKVLAEMMEVVDERDQLVALLDEHRVHDKDENADVQQVLMNTFSGLDSSSPILSSL